MTTPAAAAVMARYDQLDQLVTDITTRPVADPDVVAEVTPLLLHEARLLDTAGFESWLDLWTDDAVLWVPLTIGAHPGEDQSLFLDDRRRLDERVRWRQDPSAWGQQPPSRTVRVVGGVEAWRDPDRLVTRSAIVVHEQRRGRQATLAGHQIHELTGDRHRIRSKVLLFPQLELGVRNPSFLL